MAPRHISRLIRRFSALDALGMVVSGCVSDRSATPSTVAPSSTETTATPRTTVTTEVTVPTAPKKRLVMAWSPSWPR
jgi:hypothetical protein